jgi:conjugal transfer/entry exclusion protein
MGSWSLLASLQGQMYQEIATIVCFEVGKKAEDLFETNRTATSAVMSRMQNNVGKGLVDTQRIAVDIMGAIHVLIGNVQSSTAAPDHLLLQFCI